MLKNLVARLIKKLFPYWCPHCPKRYRKEQQFQVHFLRCEGRKAYEESRIEAIAPVNRDQRRRMAKKAGQIKDWGKLNAP